jgi:putative tryptophan/tyrosine transport system substrate-binding protein
MPDLRRREFITLLGGAATWPVAARAQQATMPVIGFVDPRSPGTIEGLLRGFREGLKDASYVEGENVSIIYRWGEGQYGGTPELTADLVGRRVAVIVVTTGGAATSAKAATATIPIVFLVAEDPVKLGLVASLARPGNNLTGINFLAAELGAKRLELVRELMPAAGRVALLVNPANVTTTVATVQDAESAAHATGLLLQVLNAGTSQEINLAFATFVRERPDALLLSPDPFFTARRVQLATLATRYTVPMIAGSRQITEAGGLVSYGANITDAFRQAGSYAGRILKGATRKDLPVVQASKFDLVMNAQTARMFGLALPDRLLAIADEVIE